MKTDMSEANSNSFLLANNNIGLICLFPYVEYFPYIIQKDKEIFFATITGIPRQTKYNRITTSLEYIYQAKGTPSKKFLMNIISFPKQ